MSEPEEAPAFTGERQPGPPFHRGLIGYRVLPVPSTQEAASRTILVLRCMLGGITFQ